MTKIASRLTVAVSALVFILLTSTITKVEAQQTTVTTVTTTRTTTVTAIVSSDVVCAKLVNVTGNCRRRRGFPIDEPIVLTFDDELGERVDAVLHPALHPQFVPTRTLGVEVTPVVYLVQPPAQPQPFLNGYHPQPQLQRPSFRHSMDYISPSMHVVEPSARLFGRKNYNAQQYQPVVPRIYFAELFSLISAIGQRLSPQRTTFTATVTNVVTETTTRTTGTTASFFVMSCTPRPFPFPVCPARRDVTAAA